MYPGLDENLIILSSLILLIIGLQIIES